MKKVDLEESLILFANSLIDNLLVYIESDPDLDDEDKVNMANKCGQDFSKFIKTYTGIDTTIDIIEILKETYE